MMTLIEQRINHIMPTYPLDRPARKSPRLKGYDYAQDGAYFVTICTQNRVHLFGDVVDGAMVLNPAGKMFAAWWGDLPKRFPSVDTDLFAVSSAAKRP